MLVDNKLMIAAAATTLIQAKRALDFNLDTLSALLSGKYDLDAVYEVLRLTTPRWHFSMLNDLERNDAFSIALEKQIESGMHVLDIGTGSGLLALLAARAGAAEVTTCEASPVLAEIACQVLEQNGMSERATVVPKLSTDMVVGRDISRKADIIVTEIVDCGLIGEGLLPTMRHAREHLLAPGGRILPRAARVYGKLLESNAIADLNRVTVAAGFDVRALNATATSGHFPVRLSTWPRRYLSDEVELVSFDLESGALDNGARNVHFQPATDGHAHGVVAWFVMDLSSGLSLSNSPDKVNSHWMQAFVPFLDPVPVRAGQALEVTVRWHETKLHVHAVHDMSSGEDS